MVTNNGRPIWEQATAEGRRVFVFFYVGANVTTLHGRTKGNRAFCKNNSSLKRLYKPAANTRAAAPPKPQPPAVCKSSHPTEKKEQQEHNARRIHTTESRHGADGVHIRPVVCPYPQQSKRRPKPQHVHNMDKYRQHGQPPHIEEVTSPRPIWTTWTTEHRHARRVEKKRPPPRCSFDPCAAFALSLEYSQARPLFVQQRPKPQHTPARGL